MQMHPLCCPGGCPPPPLPPQPQVAGMLYKWINIGKGWRPRWFAIRGPLLAYSKIPRRSASSSSSSRPIGILHLKISSFRQSKSDDKRFYIITPTKTLQLRTESASDRAAWIEALVSARAQCSASGDLLRDRNDASFSTLRLRNRMHAQGLGEDIIKDCEQIVHSEFSHYHAQMKQHCGEYLRFLGSLPQQLEIFNEDDTANNCELHSHLMKPDYSAGHGKYSSNTESSDDAGQQELDELSDQDDFHFYDTRQSFSDSTTEFIAGVGKSECQLLSLKRRTRLPEPVEKEKGVSLWSLIKDNVGKDLTRVCLPVYFNEPLSSLQKCFEDLEYSFLLDRAYECGLKGNSLMRILFVAAFAVSGYASSDGRPCKPFNPLLGETYEADYTEKGIRFFSEKVSHHPMVMACHCEGKGWKFWGDSNVKSKFWGQTIQLDPVGVLTLEFDDGESYQWSKVTTTINNLIIGRVYCHHHGSMNIIGNKGYSCKLTFKQQSFLDRNPRQVQGFVEDVDGAKDATLIGRWDSSMYYTNKDASRVNCGALGHNADTTVLWEKNEPSVNPTRYNLPSFAITLNELTPELKKKLPPTDSRLRPDQRHLEKGEYDKANSEKLRLEARQRMSRKMQDNGWRPRWFQRESKDGTFRYTGGYWEAREKGEWDACRDIFGEFSDSDNANMKPSALL